jgi:hypothetical protein
MEKIGKAERKERAKKKREHYGDLILSELIKAEKEYGQTDYALQVANRFVNRLMKENPQEADLIRTSCREVQESIELFNKCFGENASTEQV